MATYFRYDDPAFRTGGNPSLHFGCFGGVDSAVSSGKLTDTQKQAFVDSYAEKAFFFSGSREEGERLFGTDGHGLASFLREYSSLLSEDQKTVCGKRVVQMDDSGAAIKNILRLFPKEHSVVDLGVRKILEIGRKYLQMKGDEKNRGAWLVAHRITLNLTSDFSRKSLTDEQHNALRKQSSKIDSILDDLIRGEIRRKAVNVNDKLRQGFNLLREREQASREFFPQGFEAAI